MLDNQAGRNVLTCSAKARGFSLIEAMVTVTVLFVLLLAAMPSLGTWLADSRIRSAAESLQNGLRLAQAEAMQHNRRSVFTLTTATPALRATPTPNGRNWYVRLLPLTASDESDDSSSDREAKDRFIEGSTFATQAGVSITGPALLCFGPLGRQVTLDANATGLNTGCTASDPVTYTVSAPSSSNVRTLKVQVYQGGRVRMCDPAKTLSNENPDGC